ncbi:MAG: hypothetical protein LCH73_00390 [Proteobacteria bacterium]|nr:hypothetical protein [Pseudomonadota bacterium]
MSEETANGRPAGRAAPAVTSRDPMRAAMLRLAASRSQLQIAMTPVPHRSFASVSAAQGANGLDPTAWLAALREYLSQWPLVRTALDALGGYWSAHPLRASSEATLAEVEQAVAPVVRRHPVTAVAVAAGAGALLVALRPWRWLAGPLKAAPRKASRWALAQLTQPAVQTALVGLLASQLARGNRSATRRGPGAGP